MSVLHRHLRGLALAATIGLSALLASPAVHADAARARAHFELARRYFQVDEYRKAIEEFKAAHVEEPDPAFLYNIAECYRHLGESKDALVFYKRFLTLSPANAPSRSNAEKRIAELQSGRGVAVAPAPTPAPTPTPELAKPPAPAPAPAPVLTAPPPPAEPAPPPVVAVDVPATGTPVAGAPEETLTAHDDGAAASRPFYKSPWFFVVLGGALAAGAIGVWALSSHGGTNIPDTDLGNMGAFR
jgi:hypothetical protein